MIKAAQIHTASFFQNLDNNYLFKLTCIMNVCSLYLKCELNLCSNNEVIMRRSYRKRLIYQPPNFYNFKPSGIPRNMLKKVTLTVDEYEAIRLADYQGLEHLQASGKMAISRPTFTRLIEKARHKISQAIIEGMELAVEGGNVEFANTLRRCRDCGDEKLSPYTQNSSDCPECGSENVEDTAQKFIDNIKSQTTEIIRGKKK